MAPLEWQRIALPVLVCVVLVVAAIQTPRYRFALLGFVALLGFAVAQNLITAELCPEYFTALHRPIRGLKDPALLGLVWAFLDLWWAGFLLGYLPGLVATVGPRPRLSPRDIVKPLLLIVCGAALVAALTAVTVWHHAEAFGLSLDPKMTELVPAKRHRELLTVACYHFSAYGTAAVGGAVLCVWVWRERRRRARAESVLPTAQP